MQFIRLCLQEFPQQHSNAKPSEPVPQKIIKPVEQNQAPKVIPPKPLPPALREVRRRSEAKILTELDGSSISPIKQRAPWDATLDLSISRLQSLIPESRKQEVSTETKQNQIPNMDIFLSNLSKTGEILVNNEAAGVQVKNDKSLTASENYDPKVMILPPSIQGSCRNVEIVSIMIGL